MDRIDRLKANGAIGVVDYKSSLTQFQFPHFFNGLNSQLPTYLAALNPYTENGRSIAPYVQQHQAITGFEANYHLGQARFLEKLDLADGKRLVGEKLKQAWLEKIREELNR
ncbi:exonuclease RexB [Streptococcus pneumoniae]|nr:exonuclease RexB [Streptococcus pneumoniae]